MSAKDSLIGSFDLRKSYTQLPREPGNRRLRHFGAMAKYGPNQQTQKVKGQLGTSREYDFSSPATHGHVGHALIAWLCHGAGL